MAAPRLKFDYRGEWAYALTFGCFDKKYKFTENTIVQSCLEVLKQACTKYEFEIWCYCFMPDHLHLLLRGTSATSDLRKCIQLFKQRSGYLYRQAKQEPLWQASYYDQVIAQETDLKSIVRYILGNPVRASLVRDFRLYPFSGSLIFEIEHFF